MALSHCIELRPDEERRLLGIARSSIAHGLRNRRPGEPDPASIAGALEQHLGNFVTLTKHEALRGCIGSIEPTHPLASGIAIAAFNAAFRDHRFSPLSENEFESVRIEISVLTPPEDIGAHNNHELLAALRPGEDGLLLEDIGYRSTFLPIVWEKLSDPAEFVRHLKQKAGLPADYWSDSLRVSRYRTISFAETEPANAALD
jgi:AmmeMemoRadiSam system protein A